MVMMIMTITLTKTILCLRTTAYDSLAYIPWKSQKSKSLYVGCSRSLQVSHCAGFGISCEGLGVDNE